MVNDGYIIKNYGVDDCLKNWAHVVYTFFMWESAWPVWP